MSTLLVILISAGVAVLPICLLVLYGIIGPPWLRLKMKRFMNFFDYDNALFFPYDHTKPSKEALEEMTGHWWLTPERVKKVFPRWLMVAIIAPLLFWSFILIIVLLFGP